MDVRESESFKQLQKFLETGYYVDLLPERKGHTRYENKKREVIPQERNDKCNCGSGKKFKNCCGR